MRFTIVVSAYNRLGLLLAALESVRQQTFADWDVVVVDDGSRPPLSIDEIQAAAGCRAHLARHDVPSGLPAVNNTGLQHALGEIVVYLDDDDLLPPTALQTLDELFRRHGDIDCIFMNVEAFGANAVTCNANQGAALRQLLSQACVGEDNDLWLLGPEAFDALLTTIPVAMQRPAATRRAWDVVGRFNEETPFSKSEWAVRAAARVRVAISKEPLQLWRVDNQNYFSLPAQFRQGLDARLATLRALLSRYRSSDEADAEKATKVRQRLGDAYFDRAWFVWEDERRTDWPSLAKSLRLRPHYRPLRFVLRNLLRSLLPAARAPSSKH